jgi:hypothetical protein
MTLSERGRFVALKRWNAIKAGKGKNGKDAGLVSGTTHSELVELAGPEGFRPSLLERRN